MARKNAPGPAEAARFRACMEDAWIRGPDERRFAGGEL